MFVSLLLFTTLILPTSVALQLSTGVLENAGILSHPFNEGNFLEYDVGVDVLRMWNFSRYENEIISHNGSIHYEPGVRNTLSIRIDFIDMIDSNTMKTMISYYASTTIGYDIATTIELELDPLSGECKILNGSFSGLLGKLSLLYDNTNLPETEVLSSLGSHNVSVVAYIEKVGIQILGGYQAAQVYNCSIYDPVDGIHNYKRYYDEDTSVLIRSFGFVGDPILFGLANVSFVSGEMNLVDTNIDLGSAIMVPIDPSAYFLIIIAGIGIGTFVICYVATYRAQRRPAEKELRKKHESKKSKR